jgi:mono/diheme cytochrome c family protein
VRPLLRRCALFGLVAVSVALFVASRSVGEDAQAKALFEAKCAQCHSLSRPLETSKDWQGWSRTVSQMQGKNPALLSEPEADAIIEYLADVRRPAVGKNG